MEWTDAKIGMAGEYVNWGCSKDRSEDGKVGEYDYSNVHTMKGEGKRTRKGDDDTVR